MIMLPIRLRTAGTSAFVAGIIAVGTNTGFSQLLQTRISTGALSGIEQDGIAAFLGVPYAAPPVGSNRWRAPQPAMVWSGAFKADHYCASCAQVFKPMGGRNWTREYMSQERPDEDCLFLNIWTPARSTRERMPVLLWIHGGGFGQGSGSVPIYNGAALAHRGIVVVTINYRLGRLGFLAHPELSRESPHNVSGNYGLLDMIAALQWVRTNITAFGGDPGNVTIDGASAGGQAVEYLMVTPLAKGLFQRAIIESGWHFSGPPSDLRTAEQSGAALAAAVGAMSIAELRAINADRILAVPQPQGMEYEPVLDGWVLPGTIENITSERRYTDTPVMLGMNADETKFPPATITLSRYRETVDNTYGKLSAQILQCFPAASDAEAAAMFQEVARSRGRMALYHWAEARWATGGHPIYAYYFNHVEPGPDAAIFGAFHGSEAPYIFQTLAAAPERAFSARDREISDKMAAYWVNFVKTGNPNGAGLAAWPVLDSKGKQIMVLGDRFQPECLLNPEEFKIFEQFARQGGELSLF